MSSPHITIDVELSREGLLELRAALDTLLSDLGVESQLVADGDLAMQADRKVGEIWGRVGDNIKRFLILGARLNDTDDAEFSMADISRELNTSVKTVRSWHRNLGRSLRQVDEAIPEPPFMIGRWDGERQQYRFPPEIRKAILDRFQMSQRLDIALEAEVESIEASIESTPIVALRNAVAVLERELGYSVAGLEIELPDDDPSARVLVKAAHRGDLITTQAGDAMLELFKLRDDTANDYRGTGTSADQAREVLSRVRLLLLELLT